MQISIYQCFRHIDVIQPCNLDHHQGIISPVNISTHPVNGQALAIVYACTDDHFTSRAIQFTPFNPKPISNSHFRNHNYFFTITILGRI